MSLKKDNFLSSVLGYDVYNLKNTNFKTQPKKKNGLKKTLYCASVDIADFKSFDYFINNNFKLVSINLVFELDKKNINNKKNNSVFRLAKDEDQKGVLRLSKSFSHNRFHSDQMISNKKADKIKLEWTKNFFLKKRGDYMIVAEKNNNIFGYMILLKKNKNLIIDLIAIDKKYRNKGYGSKLIYSILNFKQIKFHKIIVGTQLNNISSLNLYNKLQFKIKKSYYNLHLHN